MDNNETEQYDGVIAYVDGSFQVQAGRYGFGCVLITPDGIIDEKYGSGNNPDSAALRNVTGEMLGAMFAVKWAMARGYQSISLRYDYEGIEKWATSQWKSKTELTKKYAKAMMDWSRRIHIEYRKITAHTGDKWNERADELAKKAIEEEAVIPDFR